MSAKYKGCLVTFESDIHQDSVQGILEAIQHIRGVADVSPEEVDHEDHMARCRVKQEIRKKFWEFYDETLK